MEEKGVGREREIKDKKDARGWREEDGEQM